MGRLLHRLRPHPALAARLRGAAEELRQVPEEAAAAPQQAAAAAAAPAAAGAAATTTTAYLLPCGGGVEGPTVRIHHSVPQARNYSPGVYQKLGFWPRKNQRKTNTFRDIYVGSSM